MKSLPTLLLVLFLVGCSSLYQDVITITAVVDAAMKDWAALSVTGKTSPALDAKVALAHDQYRHAAAVAQNALLAYKATGDQNQYIGALQAAKIAAQGLIDIIAPLLNPNEADRLTNNLIQAKRI